MLLSYLSFTHCEVKQKNFATSLIENVITFLLYHGKELNNAWLFSTHIRFKNLTPDFRFQKQKVKIIIQELENQLNLTLHKIIV